MEIIIVYNIDQMNGKARPIILTFLNINILKGIKNKRR
jgi:hypothetical protein